MNYKFYVDENNDYVLRYDNVAHIILRQDEACPKCKVGLLFHAPDHLYCHQCETRFDLPTDQELKRVGAPMLPGMGDEQP